MGKFCSESHFLLSTQYLWLLCRPIQSVQSKKYPEVPSVCFVENLACVLLQRRSKHSLTAANCG